MNVCVFEYVSTMTDDEASFLTAPRHGLNAVCTHDAVNAQSSHWPKDYPDQQAATD